MFDESSRYYAIETATFSTTDESGRTVSYLYKRRRFLPRLAEQTTLLEHKVQEGDRLDNLSVQFYQEPLSAFRLGDGNPVLHPEDLLYVSPRRVRVAMPRF